MFLTSLCLSLFISLTRLRTWKNLPGAIPPIGKRSEVFTLRVDQMQMETRILLKHALSFFSHFFFSFYKLININGTL